MILNTQSNHYSTLLCVLSTATTPLPRARQASRQDQFLCYYLVTLHAFLISFQELLYSLRSRLNSFPALERKIQPYVLSNVPLATPRPLRTTHLSSKPSATSDEACTFYLFFTCHQSPCLLTPGLFLSQNAQLVQTLIAAVVQSPPEPQVEKMIRLKNGCDHTKPLRRCTNF